MKRDNAATLLSRSKCRPVSFLHNFLDDHMKGGLRAGQILLLSHTYEDRYSATDYLYSVLAHHVAHCNAGSVSVICTPGSPLFNLNRFLVSVETELLRSGTHVAAAALEQRLRDIVSNVHVAIPRDVEEFFKLLASFAPLPTTLNRSDGAPDGKRLRTEDRSQAVPLLVLQDFGFASCYFSSLERCSEAEVPLQVALNHVASTAHCAILCVESNNPLEARRFGCEHPGGRFVDMDSAFSSTVVAKSSVRHHFSGNGSRQGESSSGVDRDKHQLLFGDHFNNSYSQTNRVHGAHNCLTPSLKYFLLLEQCESNSARQGVIRLCNIDHASLTRKAFCCTALVTLRFSVHRLNGLTF